MRRLSVCVSSRLAIIEVFVIFRSGACQPETQVGDLIVTESDGSARSKIAGKNVTHGVHQELRGHCSVRVREKLQGLDLWNAVCVKRAVFCLHFGRERMVEGGW